jgi:enamine deaminase RidA (YjgF/YER057c/UK114 family)
VTIERHNPESLGKPSGFSHAVTARGSTLVLLAGQTALDGEGNIVGGDLVRQFEQALTRLLEALAAAGGAPEHLARVTVYATDVDEYQVRSAEIGAAWRRLAGRQYPAMALIGVTRLWEPDALVEIDGVAMLP